MTARKLLLLALLAPLPLLGAPMIQDNFLLTGQPVSVGNDGAAETTQNPAYLAFPLKNQGWTLGNHNVAGIIREFEISTLKTTEVDSSLVYGGGLGIIGHNLISEKLHLGLQVGSNLQDGKSDGLSQPNSFNLVDLQASATIDFPNTTLNKNEIKFEDKQSLVKVGLGAGISLNKEHSMGLGIEFGMGNQDGLTVIGLQTDNWFSSGLTFEHASTTTTTVSSQRLNVILGYVNKTADGDMAIRLKPFSAEKRKINYSFDSKSSFGTSTTTINESKNADVSILIQPTAGLGFSQLFLKTFKLYVDGEVGFPVQNSATLYEEDFGNLFKNDVTAKEKFSVAASVGAAVPLGELITIYIGAKGMQYEGEKESVEAEFRGNKVFTSTRARNWIGHLGFSFWHLDPWYLFLGGQFSQDFLEKAEGKARESTDQYEKMQAISGIIGARVIF